MRRPFFLAGYASLVLVGSAMFACSASGDPEPLITEPDSGDTGASTLDGALDAPPNEGFPDANTRCSSAGWCDTDLPEADLTVEDIWPLSGRAFAVASGTLRPSTVLEWSDAAGRWTRIDDESQNFIRGAPRSIWAPNENEVYFTITYQATRSAYVYRGTRPVAPETKWSWTSWPLPCSAGERPRSWADRASLWGSGEDDVYVLSCKRIYHLNRSAAPGEFPWIVEYTDDDPTAPLEFLGGAGTAADDAWFVGGRGGIGTNNCLVLLRKTPTGYERVVDGVFANNSECLSRKGVPAVRGAFLGTGASPAHAFAKGQVVGVLGGLDRNDALKIAALPGGGYTMEYARPGAPLSDVQLQGIWAASEDDLWLLGTRVSSGTSFVLRATNPWGDGGTYEFSTLARNGVPNFSPLDVIRGTSVSNLWAVGDGRAYHKTFP